MLHFQTRYLKDEPDPSPVLRDYFVEDPLDFNLLTRAIDSLKVGVHVVFRDISGAAVAVLLHPSEYELLNASADLAGDLEHFETLSLAMEASNWMTYRQTF